MPLKTDRTYAAGLIDGEGSIGARAFANRRTFAVTVSVSMCDREPLDFLALKFGGKVRIEKGRTKSGKLIYSWSLYCRNAARFLVLILPFLKIKASRARDAIQLARMMKSRTSAKMAMFSDEEIRRRGILAGSIRSANISSNGRLIRLAVKGSHDAAQAG